MVWVYCARYCHAKRSRNLLKLCSVRYAGLQFPTMANGRTPDFAVIRIFDEDRDDKWQVGFYSFHGDIMQIEERVQTCTRSGKPSLGRKLESAAPLISRCGVPGG